jgi:hypothetical protein
MIGYTAHHKGGSMKLKKNEKAKFNISSSDRCVWLNDLRGKPVEIHMTPEQATTIGRILIDTSMNAANGRDQSYPIA